VEKKNFEKIKNRKRTLFNNAVKKQKTKKLKSIFEQIKPNYKKYK
jgi:hypothetical protein